MDSLCYQFDQELANYDKAIQAIENINEVLTAIGKHGLQESIKDLFGKDLAMLVPAFETMDDDLQINKFNEAQKGLGAHLLDILKAIWQKIYEFVSNLVEFFRAKIQTLVNRIRKLMGIGIDEAKYKELCDTTTIKRHKDLLTAFIEYVKAHSFAKLVDEISLHKYSPDLVVRHKKLFAWLNIDNGGSELEEKLSGHAITIGPMSQLGYGPSNKDKAWLTTHASWLTDHKSAIGHVKDEIKEAQKRIMDSLPAEANDGSINAALIQADYKNRSKSVAVFIKQYFKFVREIIVAMDLVTTTLEAAAIK
jgi:gas vesicle protein